MNVLFGFILIGLLGAVIGAVITLLLTQSHKVAQLSDADKAIVAEALSTMRDQHASESAALTDAGFTTLDRQTHHLDRLVHHFTR